MPTADEAVIKGIEEKLGDSQLKCFRAIVEAGDAGMTGEEVETKTALPHQNASARLWELRKLGVIRDKGIRRKTRSGRGATVWVYNKQ